MKNFSIIDKEGIKLNTANTYVDDDITVGLSENDKGNLIAENIKKDVEVLGVLGTNTMACYDGAFREVGEHELHMTSSLGINYQKDLYIDDVQSVVVNDTCYLSTGEEGNIIADNLSAENIKSGVKILGVVGTHDGGTDTSDATATANDILVGKTAYIGGGKIEGNIFTYDGSYEEGVEVTAESCVVNVDDFPLENIDEEKIYGKNIKSNVAILMSMEGTIDNLSSMMDMEYHFVNSLPENPIVSSMTMNEV